MASSRTLPPHVLAAIERGAAKSQPIARATRAPVPKGMNKLESAWADVLRERERSGAVAWFRWEGITLKLGHDTRYTPDFAVVLSNGEFECQECKGPFFRDDAKVKLKIAADLYPMRFVLVRRDKDGVWTEEPVSPR